MSMKCDMDSTPMPSSDINLAWAAGFFDGDGCTSITKQQVEGRKNKTYRLRLTLVQNCPDTLKHFERVLDEHAFITTPGPKMEYNKQIYSLIYSGRHAVAVLQKLHPHLVRKKMGASAAMRFWQEGRMGTLPGPKGFDADVWKAREYWFKKLKMLHQR